MTLELQQLIALQGDMKMWLMNRYALTQDDAHAVAADMLDIVARSKVATEQHRQAYAALHTEGEVAE